MGSCASRAADSISLRRKQAPTKKSKSDGKDEHNNHSDTEGKNGNDTTATTSENESTAVTLRQKGGGTANERGVKRAKRTSFYDTVDAAEILPHLVMGNIASSRNPEFLRRKNIGFILNLTTEGEGGGQGRIAELGIEQLRVQIEDDEDEDISGHFDVCFEFINKAKPKFSSVGNLADSSRKRNSSMIPPVKTVLVYSNYGLSRTSAIVLAYLIREKQWSLKQANEHMRKCRSAAKPNDGFVVQLLRYEQELLGSMSMTLKDFYKQP